MNSKSSWIQLNLFDDVSNKIPSKDRKTKNLREQLPVKFREQDVVEVRCCVDADIEGEISTIWLIHELDYEMNVDEVQQHPRRLFVRALVRNDPKILLDQLKKYGDKVELIGPPELREQMTQEVKRVYDLYFNQGKIRPI